MTYVADYSNGPPMASALKAAGYVGAVRYLPKMGSSGVVVLTPREVTDFRARDLDLAVIFESQSGGRAMQGRAAGAQDGEWALARAIELLGHTPRCIYFAVDAEVIGTVQMGAVGSYFDGVASKLGGVRRGGYGQFSVIEYLFDTNRIHWGWQTRAWSGGKTSSRACLYQDATQRTVAGVGVDNNLVLKADWGQDSIEEDDMPITEADSELFWSRDIRVGDTALPAWRALVEAHDSAAAAKQGLAALNNQLAEVKAAITALPQASTTSGPVDIDALAAALAPLVAPTLVDLLAKRLES